MGKSEKNVKQLSVGVWKPMKRTELILSKWRDKILKAQFTINDLEELEQEILTGGKYHVMELDSDNHIKYSDAEYSKKEAMVDFILAVCPYLSEISLYRFCKIALHKESRYLDNTFLRNNELARYLIAFEIGLHSKGENIPTVLNTHLKTLIDHFSNESCVNIVNHSILKLISNLKNDYHGFENLNIAKPLTFEDISKLRRVSTSKTADGEKISSTRPIKLSKKQPDLPSWLIMDEPIKRNQSGIFNFFSKEKKDDDMDFNKSVLFGPSLTSQNQD